jgi:hypothetical protein
MDFHSFYRRIIASIGSTLTVTSNIPNPEWTGVLPALDLSVLDEDDLRAFEAIAVA